MTHQLDQMTWPEVAEATAGDPVVVVPAGTVEQHGPHLPLDTDNRIADAFVRAAVDRAELGTALIGPPILFGLSRHLADFPGAVYHTTQVMITVVTEVLSALAQGGFRRVLVVNAHGSNIGPIELAAHEALHRHPDCLFASVSWWELEGTRRVAVETGPTSPASHACAYETSLMLAIAPERVQLDQAVPGEPYPESAHIWRDMFGRPPDARASRPIRVPEYWNGWSLNGVRGDPTEATAALGQRLLDAGGRELATIVGELRSRPILGRPAVPRLAPFDPLASPGTTY